MAEEKLGCELVDQLIEQTELAAPTPPLAATITKNCWL